MSDLDVSVEPVPPDSFPVVGVGVSAGGLEAFTRFLRHIPVPSGVAILLVQHLDPSRESLLTEILSRETTLPVREATDGMPVEVNGVYVIPPDVRMSVEGSVIRLHPRGDRSRHHPADYLFRSLAVAFGHRAVAVVLSGGGTDGTLGLADIREAGGVAFAQDPGTAGHAGMPVSAAGGGVDAVLPPEEIARALIRLIGEPGLYRRPASGWLESFEFQLPDEVYSFSELPPIPDADPSTHGALPPKPEAGQRTGASFDFINVSGSRSFADIDFEGPVIDPVELPAEAAPPAPASVPDSGVGLGELKPVEPASGWLDSGVLTFNNPAGGSTAQDSDLPLAEEIADATEPDSPRKRIPGLSSADFELPPLPTAREPEDDGAVGWGAAALADDEHATRGIPQDASLSAILRGELPDDSDEVSTKNPNACPRTPAPTEVTEQPEVSVDWLVGSNEGSAVADPVPPKPAESKKKIKDNANVDPADDAATDENDGPMSKGLKGAKSTKRADDEDCSSSDSKRHAPGGWLSRTIGGWLKGSSSPSTAPVRASTRHQIELPQPITDRVHFSVTAPASLGAGQTHALNVWAHLDSQRQDVLNRARDAHPLGPVQVHSKGAVGVARGTVLTVRFRVPAFDLAEPEDVDAIEWDGEVGNATFLVHVPAEITWGSYPGLVTIFAGGLQIAKVNFVLQVASATAPTCPLESREVRYKSAFASYASQDRDAVLGRIQGLQKALPDLEIFLDVAALRSGDSWAERLEREVATRDVFYLFWSANASASVWVEREWRVALRARGIGYIDPVPLIDPRLAPPPPELASALHFNDWVLAFMRGSIGR